MKVDKKGISPVIATVIIVSVAIAIAVAVAFWMTGITGLFTRYERVEITNCYADWNTTAKAWIIVIQLRNSGSDDATIDEIFINGRPHAAITNLQDHYIGYVSQKTSASLTNDTLGGTNQYVYAQYDIDDNGDNDTIWPYYGTATSNYFTQFDFINGVPLKAGEDMTIVIIMPGPGAKDSNDNSVAVPFKHGASIEIKLHTAAGKEYPKTVVLP